MDNQPQRELVEKYVIFLICNGAAIDTLTAKNDEKYQPLPVKLIFQALLRLCSDMIEKGFNSCNLDTGLERNPAPTTPQRSELTLDHHVCCSEEWR